MPVLYVLNSESDIAYLNALNSMLDKDNLPCYAECTRFSTRTLLRRWGYRDAGSPLHIDGFSKLFPIWREPRGITGVY